MLIGRVSSSPGGALAADGIGGGAEGCVDSNRGEGGGASARAGTGCARCSACAIGGGGVSGTIGSPGRAAGAGGGSVGFLVPFRAEARVLSSVGAGATGSLPLSCGNMPF